MPGNDSRPRPLATIGFLVGARSTEMMPALGGGVAVSMLRLLQAIAAMSRIQHKECSKRTEWQKSQSALTLCLCCLFCLEAAFSLRAKRARWVGTESRHLSIQQNQLDVTWAKSAGARGQAERQPVVCYRGGTERQSSNHRHQQVCRNVESRKHRPV